jgi:hypothetical protein
MFASRGGCHRHHQVKIVVAIDVDRGKPLRSEEEALSSRSFDYRCRSGETKNQYRHQKEQQSTSFVHRR